MTIFKHTKDQQKGPAKSQNTVDSDEELAAVIALGLHFHIEDIHDYEKTVITMQKVMRPYSPWSSKIHGMRQMPLYIPRNLLRNK